MTQANFGSGALMAADNKLIIRDKGELILADATPGKHRASAHPNHRRQMLDRPRPRQRPRLLPQRGGALVYLQIGE
jgi:hypothetical protein